MNTEKKIIEILTKYTSYSSTQIHSYSALTEDLNLNSLDLLNLLFEIEEVFNIAIPEEDAASFHTIHEVAVYIESKKALM